MELNQDTSKVSDNPVPEAKSKSNGSLLARRFMLYDKIKLPLKVIDTFILICALLLFTLIVVGTYYR